MMTVLYNQDGESPQGFNDQMNTADSESGGDTNAMTMESGSSSMQGNDFQGDADIAAGGVLVFVIIGLAIWLICVIGLWKMFNKASIPGILSIIPIVNMFFYPKLAGRPGWWGLLFFIPLVGVVIQVIICLGASERFGRGLGTALGLIFLAPIFVCILGFGSAKWTPAPAES
mgnify:CR=1 FL=1